MKKALWIITMIILTVISSLFMSHAHETTHAQICESFSGNVTSMEIHLITNSNMTCIIKPTPEYTLAQANVDAFGYQLIVFLDMIYLLIMIYGVFTIGDSK